MMDAVKMTLAFYLPDAEKYLEVKKFNAVVVEQDLPVGITVSNVLCTQDCFGEIIRALDEAGVDSIRAFYSKYRLVKVAMGSIELAKILWSKTSVNLSDVFKGLI